MFRILKVMTKDGIKALTPSNSSLAMESEEAVESMQGLENKEIDTIIGTKNFPSLPIVYVWNIEFSAHSKFEIFINISAPRDWC